jgi:voltage-gated potassium channel Kch
MVAFLLTLKNFVGAVWRGLRDPEFRALAVVVAILLATGTVFYWRFEDWSVLDSLYFSVITLTTVGYGDLSPTSAPTKVFTVIYVLLGLGILVSFLSLLARHAIDARVERQEGRRNRRRGSGGD